jgi:hypothetical protein
LSLDINIGMDPITVVSSSSHAIWPEAHWAAMQSCVSFEHLAKTLIVTSACQREENAVINGPDTMMDGRAAAAASKLISISMGQIQ